MCKCTDLCLQSRVQEPSDPGEVHHPEANQEQQGERAPPGVPAGEDGVCGAGAVESVRKAGIRAGTHGGKRHNPKVPFFFSLLSIVCCTLNFFFFVHELLQKREFTLLPLISPLRRYMTEGSILRNYADVLVILMRLRQLCCHPDLSARSSSDAGGAPFLVRLQVPHLLRQRSL